MTTADSIYTAYSLHTLPHRWRIRQIIRVLKSLAMPTATYADVGCGDGFVTVQIARALRCRHPVGFDFNPELLQLARRHYPEIDFRRWNLAEPGPGEKYSVVTCLETLEHVSDIRNALKSLVSMTEHILLMTVPIEIGPIGIAKFAAKLILGLETLNPEHEGSKLAYFRTLVRGGSISQFRQHSQSGHWTSHTGFDYRELDKILHDEGIPFKAQNKGWNRFYLVRPQSVQALLVGHKRYRVV